ncbi:hypothetical protein PG989_010758 [Apiospora arundinis]
MAEEADIGSLYDMVQWPMARRRGEPQDWEDVRIFHVWCEAAEQFTVIAQVDGDRGYDLAERLAGKSEWNCLLLYVRSREQAEWNVDALRRLLGTPVGAYIMADKPHGDNTCLGVAIFVQGSNGGVPGGDKLPCPQLLPFFTDEAWMSQRALTDVAIGNLNVRQLAGTEVRLIDRVEYHGKQVVLSARAHRTPQILMLSGLGLKEMLDEYGIKTVVGSPEVGNKFSDHVTVRKATV